MSQEIVPESKFRLETSFKVVTNLFGTLMGIVGVAAKKKIGVPVIISVTPKGLKLVCKQDDSSESIGTQAYAILGNIDRSLFDVEYTLHPGVKTGVSFKADIDKICNAMRMNSSGPATPVFANTGNCMLSPVPDAPSPTAPASPVTSSSSTSTGSSAVAEKYDGIGAMTWEHFWEKKINPEGQIVWTAFLLISYKQSKMVSYSTKIPMSAPSNSANSVARVPTLISKNYLEYPFCFHVSFEVPKSVLKHEIASLKFTGKDRTLTITMGDKSTKNVIVDQHMIIPNPFCDEARPFVVGTYKKDDYVSSNCPPNHAFFMDVDKKEPTTVGPFLPPSESAKKAFSLQDFVYEKENLSCILLAPFVKHQRASRVCLFMDNNKPLVVQFLFKEASSPFATDGAQLSMWIADPPKMEPQPPTTTTTAAASSSPQLASATSQSSSPTLSSKKTASPILSAATQLSSTEKKTAKTVSKRTKTPMKEFVELIKRQKLSETLDSALQELGLSLEAQQRVLQDKMQDNLRKRGKKIEIPLESNSNALIFGLEAITLSSSADQEAKQQSNELTELLQIMREKKETEKKGKPKKKRKPVREDSVAAQDEKEPKKRKGVSRRSSEQVIKVTSLSNELALGPSETSFSDIQLEETSAVSSGSSSASHTETSSPEKVDDDFSEFA